ncbi:MAG: hypothetical protein AABZ53_01685 [Planctomycetota bacterium]
MKHHRVVTMVLVCLAGGLITSYGVAWWAMYRFDDSRMVPAAFERLALPAAWPMPAPPGWPSIAELREQQAGSPGLQPHVEGWRSVGVDLRYTFAEDVHSTLFSMCEVRTGWPARTASRFEYRARAFAGGPGVPEDTHPWFAGLYLVDRPILDSKGGRTVLTTPVLFPLRPVWPGVLINTACYGVVYFALALGTRHLIRARRRRNGLCVNCRYPIGSSPVCTECGTPVSNEARA